MWTTIFVIVIVLILLYQKHREGRWFNLLSIFMFPYLVIVFFNNFIFYKIGFYKISDQVLIMILCAFLAFFLGTLFFRYKSTSYDEVNNIKLLNQYNFKAIKNFLYITGVLGLCECYVLYRRGLIFNSDGDLEGVMGNGPIGHLLLASYSVLPIYFLYWTYHKKKTDLLPIILVLIVAFSSFIKYNILGPVITLFIFVCLYKKSILKKSLIIFSIFIIFFFVANYAIGFALVGSEVPTQFYFSHFWAYFSGSVIYDDYIFTDGVRVGVNIFYKITTFICALPNMFFNKILNETFYVYDLIPMRNISTFGESSNIVDIVGYLFPSHGDPIEIFWFLLIFFITGILFSYIYCKVCERRQFSPFLANFLTYFIFLDFYSPFFVLSAPWEIIIWATILPNLFKKHKTKNHESNRVQFI